MFLKNILLGISGSVAIGGIGYGIYASSQSNDEEKITIDEQDEELDPDAKSSVDSGDNSQKEARDTGQDNNAAPTTGVNNGTSGEKASSAGETTPGTPPAA